MAKYGVLLLALLGVVVVAAGVVELIKEAGLLTVGLDVVGSALIVLLGIWIMACAIECRSCYLEESSKS